jgi:hypothetical protein
VTPAEIKRENTATELIDLVVDEGITAKEATGAVGN